MFALRSCTTASLPRKQSLGGHSPGPLRLLGELLKARSAHSDTIILQVPVRARSEPHGPNTLSRLVECSDR